MLRRVVQRTTYSVAGTVFIGGSTITAYTNTEEGKGLRRQFQFWSHFAPIVGDYYIQTSSHSPYVKLQKCLYYNDGEAGEVRYRQNQRKTLDELHEKHAPELLEILQSLRGLYVKLGQVLSVSALPIPPRYKRELRALQSDVPGHEDFNSVIKAMIERELGQPVEELFDFIEEVPCGAASIGQAHRAKLKKSTSSSSNMKSDHDDEGKERQNENDFDVVIKVQYPHAAWQVPADIHSLGQFLNLCVWADIVDETAAKLSYDEFSRQFLSELEYTTEMDNLKLIYESSLDGTNAPYQRRNVLVPQVHEELCSNKVITMEYIPGPKMEEEARKQLQMLGIKTDRPVKEIVKEAMTEQQLENDTFDQQFDSTPNSGIINASGNMKRSWKNKVLNLMSNLFGVDSLLWMMRSIRRLVILSHASTVSIIQSMPESLVPSSLHDWAQANEASRAYAATLNLTKEWVDALFDVHGHQIFSLGCFNADCHPGNILVVTDKDSGLPSEKLGLIDFGQCKTLTPYEQYIIAKFILSIANNESDDIIANHFREIGVKTREDSTEFLAEFSKLMFGKLQPRHMEHKWHMQLHSMDKMLYFPKELSMVYRTSLLLRGLALSLQMNCCISDQWKSHAQSVVDKHQLDENSIS